MPEMIVKRDGRAVPFRREKISSAVYRAAVACGGRDLEEAERVTDDVLATARPPRGRRVLADGGRGPGPRGEGPDRARPRAHGQGIHRLPIRARPETRRPGEPHLLGGEHPVPQALGSALLGDRPRLRHAGAAFRGSSPTAAIPPSIEAADSFYEKELDEAAEKIVSRRDEIRAVIVAGTVLVREIDNHASRSVKGSPRRGSRRSR